MLQGGKLRTKSYFQRRVARLNMHIVYMAAAIRLSRNRKQECGTEQIRNLNPDVIVAVAKCGHLQDARMGVTCGLKLLREQGMRNDDVLAFGSAVGDNESSVVDSGKKAVECRENCLDRGTVNGAAGDWRADPLDENASHNPCIMTGKKTQHAAQE